MSRNKLAKLITFELLQWTAFATPVLVTGVEAAKVLRDYWLTVAVMTGYVAIATLLVWIPVKLCFEWLKLSKLGKGRWCYSMFLYVLLSFIPCVVIILLSLHQHYDVTSFQYTSVELMVIMLLVIDWTEKLKNFKLRADVQKSTQDNNANEINEYTLEGSVSGYSLGRSSQANLVPVSANSTRIASFFLWGDPRSSHLLYSLLNIYDVRMLLNVAVNSAELGVSGDSWINGIYVVSVLAACTFIPNVNNKYSAFITAIFLDFIFFFFRLSLFIEFGKVTSVLFLFKNLFVGASYVYFGLIRGLVYGGDAPQPPGETPNGMVTNTGLQSYNNANYDPYELGRDPFEGGTEGQGSPRGYHDDGNRESYRDQQQNYDQQNPDQQQYDQQNYAASPDHRYDENNDHYYHDDNDDRQQGNHDTNDVTVGFNQWEQGEFDDDVIEVPVVPQSGLKPLKRVRSKRATILEGDLYSSAKLQTSHISSTPLPTIPDYNDQQDPAPLKQDPASSKQDTPSTDTFFTPPNTAPNPPDRSSLTPPKTTPSPDPSTSSPDPSTSSPPSDLTPQEPSSVPPQVANEPTYSKINKSKKKNKNQAPPPPPTSHSKTDSDQTSNNAQNPNREVAGVSRFNHVVGPHRVSVRSGHSFTPDIASQIAEEAKRRSTWIEEEDDSSTSSFDVHL